jgi:photosystem II stability/assembly factor-like uncharacterized protein
MKNLIIVLNISIAVCFNLNAQYGSKKYLRENSKSSKIYTYGDSSIYARGIIIDDNNRLFIGSSDGSLRMFDIANQKSRLLFKNSDFEEMRDVEKVNDYFIGIQSGNSGKMLRMDAKGTMKIIKMQEWDSLFIDAIDFNNNIGFMMGDPINGVFSLYVTNNDGLEWSKCNGVVQSFKGEAGFAASGTNVKVFNDTTFAFITGGLKSRFIKTTDSGNSWSSVELPFFPGESNGAYSMCFSNDSCGIIVGGDYLNPAIMLNTTFYTTDYGASWYNATTPPRGYRSNVFFKNGVYYACGSNGIDFTINNGKDWTQFSSGNYFAMTASENKLYATTLYGQIVEFNLIESNE